MDLEAFWQLSNRYESKTSPFRALYTRTIGLAFAISNIFCQPTKEGGDKLVNWYMII